MAKRNRLLLNVMGVLVGFAATFFAPVQAAAADQSDWINWLEVSAGTVLYSGDEAPFWIRSNQEGRISNNGSGVFTCLRFGKDADSRREFDWLYGFDATVRSNSDPSVRWTDMYAGVVWKNLQFTVGRKSEFFGLADPVLTVGPELYSRNAPTIPKVALSTNGFVDVADWISVNAYLAHGWMGEEQYVKDAYLQEKYLYLRFGNSEPDRGINFYTGVHDVALWGGEGHPTGFGNFYKVFLGEKGGPDATIFDQENALGDHRGAIEFALQLKAQARDWYLYAQTMYEDKSGLKFWYPGDCLLGGSLIQKDPESLIRRVNIEYLDTRSSGRSLAGPDNFFTNWDYGGWVHEGYAIGHPFIRFIRGNNCAYSPENLVKGFNASLLLCCSSFLNPLVRIAWIRNSGSISTPLDDDQKSTVVACDLTNTMRLNDAWSFIQQVSIDTGNSMNPNFGIVLAVARSIF
jgi:hypothetical protein